MPDSLEIIIDKFTFQVPLDRLYTSGHLWLKEEGGLVRVGLTDYLQQTSGDVAFAEVTAAGSHVATGDVLATIETIKVDLELPAPVGGLVRAVNQSLEAAPELVNQDPYDQGWLAVLAPDNWAAQRAGLLDAQAYFEHMKADAEEASRKL
jgi:glycine cleavage system H protein